VDPESAAQVHPGWKLTAIGGTPVADLLRTVFDGPAAAEGQSARLQNVEAWRIAQTRFRGPA